MPKVTNIISSGGAAIIVEDEGKVPEQIAQLDVRDIADAGPIAILLWLSICQNRQIGASLQVMENHITKSVEEREGEDPMAKAMAGLEEQFPGLKAMLSGAANGSGGQSG